MTELCLMVAEQSLRLSGIILFLWVLRALLRRIPGRPVPSLDPGIYRAAVSFPGRDPLSCGLPAALEAPVSTADPEPHGTAESPAVAEPTAPQGENAASQPARTPADLLPLASVVWAAVAAGLLLVNGWKLAAFSRRLRGARQIAAGGL